MKKSSVKMIANAAVSRRLFLQGVAAAGLAGAAGTAAASNESLVIALWGGSWEAAMRRAWFDPFMSATGIKIETVTGNTLGRLQAMVDAGQPEWDLFETAAPSGVIAERRGLLERLDYSVIDRSHVMENSLMMSDYSVPQVQYGELLVYSTKLQEGPTSAADIWDLERFPGRRALPSYDLQHGLLELTLVADGVSQKDLYPLDVDRALRKLDQIKSEILWYESSAQGEQVMSSGQGALGIIADGRAHNILAAGAPVKLEPRVSILTWSLFAMPKGAKNKQNAMAFLNYILTPEAQAAIAREYTYGPIAPAAWKLLPPERLELLSGAPIEGAEPIYLDSGWWSQNLEMATEKFQAWLLS